MVGRCTTIVAAENTTLLRLSCSLSICRTHSLHERVRTVRLRKRIGRRRACRPTAWALAGKVLTPDPYLWTPLLRSVRASALLS